MRQLFAWSFIVAVGLAFPGAADASDAGIRSSAAPAEAIVEGRLLAPCCYRQTLDVHESPMATELRLEVRTRLTAGESPEAIEDDFASRYGEQVRAVPKGHDPRGNMFIVATGVLVAAGIGLGALVRRWRRTPSEPRRPIPGGRDLLDERIDEELAELDG